MPVILEMVAASSSWWPETLELVGDLIVYDRHAALKVGGG